jgi:hypothetical protein
MMNGLAEHHRSYLSEKRILEAFENLNPGRRCQFVERFGEPEEGHLQEWIESAPLEDVESFLAILYRFTVYSNSY